MGRIPSSRARKQAHRFDPQRRIADERAAKKELRELLKRMLGPVAAQLAAARQQLRREINAELERCSKGVIYPDNVAEAVHARLRPEVQISIGYIKNMVKNICHARWGRGLR